MEDPFKLVDNPNSSDGITVTGNYGDGITVRITVTELR